jgi:hypothetical protein
VPSLIDKVNLMRERRVDRGASEAEADTAALLIGRILMANPDLMIVTAEQLDRQPAFPVVDDDGVLLSGVSLIRRTAKAVYVAVPQLNRANWFPLSQIIRADWSEGEIVVAEWLWRKKCAA